MIPPLSPVARFNDLLRTTFFGGRVAITAGVRDLGPAFASATVEAVQTFKAFTPDNDPYQEHDFGAVTVMGRKVFWKIDYYDPTLRFGSENPADPKVTAHVLTIMLAEEY